MKKVFTKEYIIKHQGCYIEEKNKVHNLSFINNRDINILDIVNSEIAIKDKLWFLRNKCNLTLDNKKLLALILAECVSKIFNTKYPNDNRVNNCIKAIKDFNNNLISTEELVIAKNAAYAASAYATGVYAAAADAVYAAADVDVGVAYVAAAYAAYVADAEKITNLSYQQKLLNSIINFVNDLPQDN